MSIRTKSSGHSPASTVKKYPGAGFGLSIAQKGAERMGRQMGVESIFGPGRRFWFELRKG